ncbi:electron transport complex subunit RsxC [Enterococcus mundtii]|uniref:electron transport complex subunit RsxC n=1 Tax=Enterococcus mundtii TaxID=53346 RepID=UPI0010BF599F|nr:electron transport complex subunit RsxC [Enterococcus mundtii]QCJ56630.1 electron transport complex subunit RsxC [Enterococcus mundtii]
MKLIVKKRLNGVYLDKNKHTAQQAIEKLTPPKKIILPMSMHLGKPAKVVVEVGDKVAIGTLIVEKDGPISANVHSSVAGVVKKIENRMVNHRSTEVVIIENDFSDRMELLHTKNKVLHNIVANAGIVGMGGAGFPTDLKLLPKEEQKIHTLIINAAECEPSITSDRRLLIEDTEQMILDTYQIPKARIAIEKSSVQVIEHLHKHLIDPRIQLHILGNLYPQGAEKLVIKHVLSQEIPKSKLPFDVGVITLNVATIHSILSAALKQVASFERVVTVSGTPIKEGKNLRVRIGTPVEELIDACGGFVSSPLKVLNGGPMMGKLIQSLDEPVTKTTNLILALSAAEAMIPKEQKCIKCSECVNACPIGLHPILISQAYRHQDLQTAEQLGALNCLECGACSFICPSKINLLKDIRAVKNQIMEAKG